VSKTDSPFVTWRPPKEKTALSIILGMVKEVFGKDPVEPHLNTIRVPLSASCFLLFRPVTGQDLTAPLDTGWVAQARTLSRGLIVDTVYDEAGLVGWLSTFWQEFDTKYRDPEWFWVGTEKEPWASPLQITRSVTVFQPTACRWAWGANLGEPAREWAFPQRFSTALAAKLSAENWFRDLFLEWYPFQAGAQTMFVTEKGIRFRVFPERRDWWVSVAGGETLGGPYPSFQQAIGAVEKVFREKLALSPDFTSADVRVDDVKGKL